MSLIRNIIEISEYFIEFSEDKNELKALIQVAGNREKWAKAHRYFDQVRNKNLKAIQKKKESLEGLYCYIEICYKTLYNLLYPSDPFDADSPYYIIPIALEYCDIVDGLEKDKIIKIISG